MEIPITAKYEIEIVSPGDHQEYTSYTIHQEITRYLLQETPTTSTITGKIPGTRIIANIFIKTHRLPSITYRDSVSGFTTKAYGYDQFLDPQLSFTKKQILDFFSIRNGERNRDAK